MTPIYFCCKFMTFQSSICILVFRVKDVLGHNFQPLSFQLSEIIVTSNEKKPPWFLPLKNARPYVHIRTSALSSPSFVMSEHRCWLDFIMIFSTRFAALESCTRKSHIITAVWKTTSALHIPPVQSVATANCCHLSLATTVVEDTTYTWKLVYSIAPLLFYFGFTLQQFPSSDLVSVDEYCCPDHSQGRFSRGPGDSCCGGAPYATKGGQLCCGGSLHDGYGVQCCGGHVVDDALVCCGGAEEGQVHAHIPGERIESTSFDKAQQANSSKQM